MIGGEYSSDCDCDFSIKCFFLCIGFSLEWDLNLVITIVDLLHLKVGTYYATSCRNTSQQQITFCAGEFLQEFCSPDKLHKIKSVSICAACCNNRHVTIMMH